MNKAKSIHFVTSSELINSPLLAEFGISSLDPGRGDGTSWSDPEMLWEAALFRFRVPVSPASQRQGLVEIRYEGYMVRADFFPL